MKFNSKKINSKSGFTLIELLVAIVIFVITTGIVIFSQNKFDNGILLDNLAYDIAITVRQAQSFGVNVKESSGGSSNVAFPPYGVFFDLNQSNKNFILFSDPVIDPNTGEADLKYTGDPSCPANDSECIQKYSIKRGSYIKSLCSVDTSGNCVQTDQLTILFKRPNPDALIYNNQDERIVNNAKLQAKITVSSADGLATKDIVVTNVGQIYVAQQ